MSYLRLPDTGGVVMKKNIHRNSARHWSIVPVLILLTIFCTCGGRSQNEQSPKSNREANMQTSIPPEDIRHPAVAGSWYSDNPDELREELEGYLAQANDFNLGKVTGLISPHAGYAYSGPVAAFSYRQLKGHSYDAVVIVAPSHTESFRFAAVYGRGGYQTPFGILPVDVELAEAIASRSSLVKISDQGHRQEHLSRQEHSLEIQLPFLQLVLDDFKLVPIVMGIQSDNVVHELAEALAVNLKGKDVLLVASSDLSHFHPYDTANRIDAGVVKRVESYDPNGLLDDLNNQKVEACGGGPMCVIMETCQKLGADKSQVLKYANSGDVPHGDRNQVVGYLAAAFYGNSGKDAKKETEKSEENLLTLDEKRKLMHIARTTIENVVRGEPITEFDVSEPRLLEDRGAFVTIHRHGKLRGCIGYIIGVKPLYQTVREVAESAALRDPRFNPVRPQELGDLDLEISALSVPRIITNVEEIQIGVHGIIMRKGYHQGLLLPQVATEYGWDRKTFLEHTCLKAGLPTDAWKDKDTEIQIFSAEVFSEEEIK